MTMLNTHGIKVNFGKHAGELLTRVPLSYIKWMINNDTPQSSLAKAELERRGSTLPQVELSAHAIDNASLRVLKVWQSTRLKDEGLHSWLERMTLEALERNEVRNGKHVYHRMKLVIAEGEEFPVLKTIMKV